MSLYAMLVVPKQLLEDRHSEEFKKIQEFLALNTQKTSTTYNSDQPKIDYLRHIRNAVAHARVSFRPCDVVVFEDTFKDGKGIISTFSTELSLRKVGEFIHRLQMVHVKHIQDRQREQLRKRHSTSGRL